MMGPEGDFHPQIHANVKTITGNEEVFVDAEIASLIEALGSLDIPTYESCQNYGEYLRFMELDHVFEAKRDCAYVEFYNLADAEEFLTIAIDSGVQNPIHHRAVHEGTPDAWELKYRQSNSGHYWVWFPSYDIEGITKLVADRVIEEEMALD